MYFTLCRLTFHENLFYATREVGRLYETGRYLHNYALTYALGFACAPYFQAQQIPGYKDDLKLLNEAGIYVTPARAETIHYQIVTFKLADNSYRVKMEQGSRNIPSYGRAKEIAVGSTFQFAILHQVLLKKLPHWIRMGLWRSKARLEVIGQGKLKPVKETVLTASLPLNPLDVIGNFQVYNLISMPPSSLVDHARIESSWLQAQLSDHSKVLLPADLEYRFP